MTLPDPDGPALAAAPEGDGVAVFEAGFPGAAAVTDDLDEEVYESTAAVEPEPNVGDLVEGFEVRAALGRGWFRAHDEAAERDVLLFTRRDPPWATLAPHRLLPRWTRAGDAYVLPIADGDPLSGPLPAARAFALLADLAQLAYALERQGYALIDLDPDGLRLSGNAPRLQLPPRVAPLGAVPEPTLRDGVTPPEVAAGEPARAESGVYVLGALLYRFLTGEALPVEGASPLVLAGVRAPGAPQLLRALLAPAGERLSPRALVDALRALAAPTPAYRVAAASTVGLNPDRPVNEDAFGHAVTHVEAHGRREARVRACVADGMGGMAAGEVASRAAVDAFLAGDADTTEGLVWTANAAVLAALGGEDGGCAFSGVEVRGAALTLGHVGDTRAYLARRGEVRLLSRDHSFVAVMVSSGNMTPEEAESSPDRNKILRSLGSVRQPQPQYVHTLPEPLMLDIGDRVLLVSDGVWGEVGAARLEELLLAALDPQDTVEGLMGAALDAGAPDNATALLLERVR